MLANILLICGVLLRFLPHAPNVTPVAAIALFGAAYLPSRRLAIIMPLCLMMISDLVIGLHDVVVFTWGSVVLISLLGIALRKTSKVTTALAGSLAASVIFFAVTNFGVWLMGAWYPKTAAGLNACFIAAVPFFRNFLLGTLLYSGLLFGAYEVSERFIRKTKFSGALLTK